MCVKYFDNLPVVRFSKPGRGHKYCLSEYLSCYCTPCSVCGNCIVESSGKDKEGKKLKTDKAVEKSKSEDKVKISTQEVKKSNSDTDRLACVLLKVEV